MGSFLQRKYKPVRSNSVALEVPRITNLFQLQQKLPCPDVKCDLEVLILKWMEAQSIQNCWSVVLYFQGLVDTNFSYINVEVWSRGLTKSLYNTLHLDSRSLQIKQQNTLEEIITGEYWCLVNIRILPW